MPDEKKTDNASPAPDIVTFGCRLNTYESEIMRAHAREAGLEDVIIFNTCAVTAEAERQARQAIRKARREHPDKKIIVTGCAAQVKPELFAEMPEIDRIIGNDLKLKPESWHPAQKDRLLIEDIMDVKETAAHLVEGFEGKSRAFVQVQNGCDHRCTFCIIPYGRGPSRSVPIGEIAKQVQSLVVSGYKEIVLTGVDVTSYGHDLPGRPSLGQMIRRVLNLTPDLPRLRLSSLDPVEIDEDLWALIADEPRLMPHLHLSMQAGDDMILKRMKRRHLRADLYAVCERARALRPDIVFGADIIAGFPTETEDMFENTCRAVTECNLTWLHVFPYSAREGTPAAKMPQLKRGIVKDRAARLREIGAAQAEKFMRAEHGKIRQIIMEHDGAGRTEHFAQVRPDHVLPAGELARVRIEKCTGENLRAKIVSR